MCNKDSKIKCYQQILGKNMSLESKKGGLV